jgi:hypothetical protein
MTTVNPESGAEQSPEALLLALEARYSELEAELNETRTRLRQLRVAADLCPNCGGTGNRKVRGGLYGELQLRKCSCQGEA